MSSCDSKACKAEDPIWPFTKKAPRDPSSKGSVCEGPGELHGRRDEPAQQGWWSKPCRGANVELALKDDLGVLGSRNPLHKGMRIPGMFQKMSCSLLQGNTMHREE